jgi:AcrR family transcriptional regulator
MPATSRSSTRRRDVLSLDGIVQAAVDLVDEVGIDALTLRSVAARLGVTPMPLYRHVSTRDELVDLAVARLMEREGGERRSLPAGWQDLVRHFGRGTRDVLLRHPLILEACIRRPIMNRATVRNLEALLRALTDAGLSLESATEVQAHLITYLTGYVALRTGRTRSNAAAGRSEGEARVRAREAIEDLAGDRFPLVTAASEQLTGLVDEDTFERGLDRIIRSVELDLARG